jgi:transcriptional regulator with XRE-family HTH domain
LNENLRRALLRARLTDEDVAARLEVDPKTVRRWLDGRLPYLRHRWALAGMLGLDEADLWPQLGTASSLPAEVRAIYPHLGDVPAVVWHDLFDSASREIDILADTGLFLAADPQIRALLIERAEDGLRVRICLLDPAWHRARSLANGSQNALDLFKRLDSGPRVEIRLHQVNLNNTLICADDELLVSQQAFGVASELTPVLHLRATGSDAMVSTYLESFNRTWNTASTIDGE